ncbi:MAG: type II toxin-antitoxin system VapC family toxin [bacterium]
MLKIFIDSDIILDLLAKRNPHYDYAARLFTLVEKKQIKAYTSPLVFANIHYLLRKLTSNEQAKQNLRKLRTLVKILSIDKKVIDLSLFSEFKDFEDAIQYHTANNNGLKFLITRNKSDYKNTKITVCTAEECLKMFETLKQ